MAKIFTLAEVAEHNTQNDCWLIIFGKVVDVTSFLDDHPGGDEVLLKATGKDATGEFIDVGHTHDAWGMVDKYCIGEIDKSTIPNEETTSQSLEIEGKKSKSKYIYLLQFVIPLILLNVIAVFFIKSSA